MASVRPRVRRALAASFDARRLALTGVAVAVLVASIVVPASDAGATSLRRAYGELSARAVAEAAAFDPCEPAPGTPVPNMVAEIFRCRLASVMPAQEAAHVAAQAVVVAECESLFDPKAIVFDGAYVDRAHPRTGMRYTAAGVFQFIRATADDYIEGGYAAATDPVRNIDAAVALYLDNRANGGRGWESWECSAVNGAFKANSVLPGWPGGPPTLPAWAFEL